MTKKPVPAAPVVAVPGDELVGADGAGNPTSVLVQVPRDAGIPEPEPVLEDTPPILDVHLPESEPEPGSPTEEATS